MTADTPDQDKLPPITAEQAAQIVSRQLGLPMELQAVRNLAERVAASVNQNPTLLAAGPEGLKAFIWAITPEDPARMDPMKQAEAMLARVNITSGDAAVWGKVLESFRGVMAGGVSKEEGERSRAEALLAVLDLGKINDTNFGFTEFSAKGLSFGTFSQLRAQGFSAQQIVSAASFTKELKIDVNVNAGDIARLQRDVPGVETGLRASRDNWQSVGKIEDEAKKARARGDNARAEALEKQARETHERAEQHDREEREHVQRIRPDRLPDLQTVQGHIKAAGLNLDAAMPDAKPAEVREFRKAFDAAQRNPNDADAQRRYEEVREKVGKKPVSSRRFAEAEAEWKKQAALKDTRASHRDVKTADTQRKQEDSDVRREDTAQTDRRNDTKQVLKGEKINEGDDLLASLNDSAADAKQKTAANPKPSRPIHVTANARIAKPSQPQA